MMTRVPKASYLLLAAVSLAACDKWLTRPSLYNTVQVSAMRRDGTPIRGVQLELYTGQRPMGYGATDSTGRFVFTRVPQGDYGVAATQLPPGYDQIDHLLGGPPSNVVSGLDVANDSAPPVHFTFLKIGPGSMSVRVSGVGGVAMAGLPVELYSPQGTIAKTATDATGRASFANVPYGNYGIVVTRPYQYQGFYYRDFNVQFDSAYAYRDGFVIDEGARDSVAVALPTCTGAIHVTVVDQTGAPVPLSTAAFFTFNSTLGALQTGSNGQLTFVAPCAASMGVNINPAAGYTVGHGRGLDVFDGITVTNGQTVDITFHVQRTS